MGVAEPDHPFVLGGLVGGVGKLSKRHPWSKVGSLDRVERTVILLP